MISTHRKAISASAHSVRPEIIEVPQLYVAASQFQARAYPGTNLRTGGFNFDTLVSPEA
jgi:hypothetical protein